MSFSHDASQCVPGVSHRPTVQAPAARLDGRRLGELETALRHGGMIGAPIHSYGKLTPARAPVVILAQPGPQSPNCPSQCVHSSQPHGAAWVVVRIADRTPTVDSPIRGRRVDDPPQREHVGRDLMFGQLNRVQLGDIADGGVSQ